MLLLLLLLRRTCHRLVIFWINLFAVVNLYCFIKWLVFNVLTLQISFLSRRPSHLIWLLPVIWFLCFLCSLHLPLLILLLRLRNFIFIFVVVNFLLAVQVFSEVQGFSSLSGEAAVIFIAVHFLLDSNLKLIIIFEPKKLFFNKRIRSSALNHLWLI